MGDGHLQQDQQRSFGSGKVELVLSFCFKQILPRLGIKKFNKEAVFSIIFKSTTKLKEIDLVAEDQKTKELWVEVIRHLVNTLQSIGTQKTYEL